MFPFLFLLSKPVLEWLLLSTLGVGPIVLFPVFISVIIVGSFLLLLLLILLRLLFLILLLALSLLLLIRSKWVFSSLVPELAIVKVLIRSLRVLLLSPISSEIIVLFPLLGVSYNIVGCRYFLEFIACFPSVFVWMILLCKFVILLLYLFFRRCGWHTNYLVVVYIWVKVKGFLPIASLRNSIEFWPIK